MTLPEEAGKVATTTVEAMKSVPLALALLIVNVGFLGFAAYILGEVAANAQERNKTQMELITKLAEDLRDCHPLPRPTQSILRLPPINVHQP